VYRFLLTPRWLGLALLMALLAAGMVALGFWQLNRYEHRSAINERIDAAGSVAPAPLAEALSPPGGDRIGPAPAEEVVWSRVTASGRYDPAHEILVRGRSLNGQVGFAIVTPLVLADGTAVLVDRGWLPAPGGSALDVPDIPPAPTGEVTVVGRVHAPESRAGGAAELAGRLSVRRVSPADLAAELPYPLFGAYLTLEEQTPPNDPAFTAIGPSHERSWMNAGYVVQWWAFAVLTLVGYVVLAVKHARARENEDGGRGRESGVRHDDHDHSLDRATQL